MNSLTTGFSANVVVAETSYEILQVLVKITVLIFHEKNKKAKSKMKFSWVSNFENTRKNLKAKSCTRSCSSPRI